MSRHAFFITGDRVVPIANAAGAGFQYQAQAHVLLPQVQIGPHRHEHSETVLVVTEGALEVMVNGMASLVAAGSFVRIPPDAWFAYRNAGDRPIRVLCRTAPQQARRQSMRVTIDLTAA